MNRVQAHFRFFGVLATVALPLSACAVPSQAPTPPRTTAATASSGSSTDLIKLIAGNGDTGVPVPGPAASSPLGRAEGVAVDAAGNVYVADSASNVVVEVSASGELRVVGGNGQTGSPVPGPATQSPLTPHSLAVDTAGNLYVLTSDGRQVEAGTALREGWTLVKVTPAGVLSVLAGNGKQGIPAAGPATASPLAYPQGVAVDQTGNVYIALADALMVVKVSPDGNLSVIAGSGDKGAPSTGPAVDSPLTWPNSVAVDDAGNLFLADDAVLAKVSADGMLSIVAGSGERGAVVAGPAADSPLHPTGVALGGRGNIAVVQYGGQGDTVALVTATGQLSLWSDRLAMLLSGGVVGNGAEMLGIDGIAADTTGNLYVSYHFDRSNSVVVRLAVSGA